MEQPFPIEDLVDRVGNRYAIVVAVAKRARQLKAGAKPLVEIASNNPTTIALHEISAGFVQIKDEMSEVTEKVELDEVEQLISLAVGEDEAEEDADLDDDMLDDDDDVLDDDDMLDDDDDVLDDDDDVLDDDDDVLDDDDDVLDDDDDVLDDDDDVE